MSEDESILSLPSPPPDATLAYGPGDESVADVRYGAEGAAKRPLVVLIHGGFWRPAYDRKHIGPLAAALAAAGWTVATPEYRRSPGRPEATIEDLRAALAALPGKIDRNDGTVVLIGHSAGGHLVLWAAAAGIVPKLRGVLALAPVADLRLAEKKGLGGGAVQAFLGSGADSRADLDPLRMKSPAVPTVLLQGEGDEIVPPAIAESYVAAHPKARLVRIEGAGHFAVIDPRSTAWPVLLDELGKL
jgi:acetyl esterase/lipase